MPRLPKNCCLKPRLKLLQPDMLSACRIWLTAFNYYTTDIVSIHEAYPGHYVQFLCLNASPANKLEKVFSSYAFVEGWAHYTEQMMVDEGFGAPLDESALRAPHSALILDWAPMIEAILSDVQNGVAGGRISAKFHNALAEAVVVVAKRAGERRVVLSGGCFQNRYLTERVVRRLQAEGFRP